ncbi:MAG: DUF2177 family protein [Rhodobacteraceae bacterium]|jgi:uncharacterized membrane protein|nr:DUF2177 family protein [Paracoccaceae bacterium]
MQILVLTLVTGAVFLIADAVMLSNFMKPLFQRHLGAGLLDGLRFVPAILFYLIYLFGMVWFAGLPGLRAGPGTAALNGALLGLVAYGTYELTSWAVMRDWHPAMVAADLAWGTVLTAGAVWAGVMAARAVG